MNKEIVNIVRDRKGNPRGYVVATKLENGKVGLGWSYVNVKAGDRFDKHLAAARRGGRMQRDDGALPPIERPESVDYALSPPTGGAWDVRWTPMGRSG